ncbi:MAG: hypothetical protein WAP35_06975 [Solirubrobacterales bacterium]
MTNVTPSVRRATADDADIIGRLLHDFNTEFDETSPGPAAIAARIRELLAAGDTEVGADYMELGTSETDVAARSLYESLGFTNRESDGSFNFFYEREL